MFRTNRTSRTNHMIMPHKIILLAGAMLIASFSLFSPCATGQGTSPKPEDQQLQNGLASLVKDHAGQVGVAIRNLETGEYYNYQADKPMPTASLIKLPLMIATYRAIDAGSLTLEKSISLTANDKVPGSGVLTDHISDGVSLPLRDYIRLMMCYSDNTATNLVIEELGLEVTATVTEALGCPNTKLHSKVYLGETTIFPGRSKEFGLGSTTAAEMVRLLEMLHNGTVASETSCNAMLDHMKANANGTHIGRYLPKTVTFAHKTGSVANCRTDAGIVYTSSGPIAVCALTNENEDQSWGDDNAAEQLLGEIGRVIAKRFGSEEDSTDLQEGSFGKLVEALQRTLNARLSPSLSLSIDGDFGPGTKRAVVQFQEENGLQPDGIVTEKMWKALGTLIETDAPVPAPEIINNEKLATVPLAKIDGPPVVTCVSWAIGDPESGDALFRSDTDEPRQAASTTKIMTAHVVLEHARQHPEVLDEIVTFSSAADNTVGSTSAIRAGEQVSVRNLLYGLLLPSGNDASVALAEHFGEKWLPAEAKGGATPSDAAYLAFVAKMNETAEKLAMRDTLYKNTHGLPDDEHVTTATDLLRLASQAMQNELFQKIVSTRQFGCTLKSVQGYERNTIWKTTNRLLGIEGFCGIKTGTTNAAGSCLVSCGEYQGDRLITVVLGSSSTAARYADSQNLYRWAWQERAKKK